MYEWGQRFFLSRSPLCAGLDVSSLFSWELDLNGNEDLDHGVLLRDVTTINLTGSMWRSMEAGDFFIIYRFEQKQTFSLLFLESWRFFHRRVPGPGLTSVQRCDAWPQGSRCAGLTCLPSAADETSWYATSRQLMNHRRRGAIRRQDETRDVSAELWNSPEATSLTPSPQYVI